MPRHPHRRCSPPASPLSAFAFHSSPALSSLSSCRPSVLLPSSSSPSLLPRLPLLWLAVALLVCVCALRPCAAAVVTGVANGDDGIAFLGRFCFDYDPEPTSRVGSIEFRVTDPNHDTESGSAVGLWWAMYSDQEDSWPLVRDAGDSMTCFERRKAARVSEEFKFGSSPPFTINYPEVLVEQHLRPRFWFAVLYHCDETTVRPIRDVQYEVHFVNREQSSWDREFGTNERGLNTMYLVLLIVYSLFFVVHFIGVHRLRKQIDYLHPIVKLFATILCVQYVAWVLMFVHYFQYSQDGVGVVWLTYFGQLLDAIARILFIFLLLLLAHGWTISNDHLHQRWIIAGVLGAFFLLQVAQFGYAWYSFDPRLTSIDRGDLVLQCMVIAVYLLLGIYFVFMLVVSYANEIIPPKKKLYLRLVLLFSPWMLGPPLVAIGVLLLDDWVRTKIIVTLQTSLTIVAYFVLSFLFWPSRANEYFTINTGPSTLGDFQAAYDRL